MNHLPAEKKMIVTLTVDAGQEAGTEELSLTTATDDTGAQVRFSPVKLTTSRSEVRYRYPVFYVQNYNAQPTEETIGGSLFNQCSAVFDTKKATCGIAKDTAGNLIPYSQGFCCDCGVCQTLGICSPDSRASNACNLFNKYTSASCLRFGPVWYSGYSIGQYSNWYTINVSLSLNTTDNSNGVGSVVNKNETLSISPDRIGASSEDFGVQVRWIGDFNPTEQPLDLSSRMLFVPSLPRDSDRVKNGPAEWMILDTNLVTLDGRTCNKVGVSYEAFSSQGNACRLNPGSCLGSQLEDYRTEDAKSAAAGKRGKYMATTFGDFDLETFQKNTSASKSPYITYVATSPAASMITITISADDLQYIVAVATGIIVNASLNMDVLAASTKDGVMNVRIQNTGAIVSRFAVEVADCSEGVFPVPAQTASIQPSQVQDFAFAILAQDVNYNGTANCTVYLRNSLEAIVDQRLVGFKVSPVDFNNGTQGGTAGDGGKGSTSGSDVQCSSCVFMNLVCSFKGGCAGKIVGNVAFMVGIVVALVLVIRFRKYVCCCLKGCCSSSSSSDSRPRRKRRHEEEPGNVLPYGGSLQQQQMLTSLQAQVQMLQSQQQLPQQQTMYGVDHYGNNMSMYPNNGNMSFGNNNMNMNMPSSPLPIYVDDHRMGYNNYGNMNSNLNGLIHSRSPSI
ncbi:hypothetical protein AGDE_02240 [Angomonas deanei]|nr:hypothetical protein AGDE_02240 [Angomonas deanei]|eukprot:EPY41684.1 hypothetical protein AGDE_02240 [Angomonas deanei]